MNRNITKLKKIFECCGKNCDSDTNGEALDHLVELVENGEIIGCKTATARLNFSFDETKSSSTGKLDFLDVYIGFKKNYPPYDIGNGFTLESIGSLGKFNTFYLGTCLSKDGRNEKGSIVDSKIIEAIGSDGTDYSSSVKINLKGSENMHTLTLTCENATEGLTFNGVLEIKIISVGIRLNR